MKFRFCGDADCPDWVLAEINTLSRISSIKVKHLAQLVAQGIVEPPINMEKVEKLFADSKLDSDVDLRACVACLSFIITSAVRFSCDTNALFSELQQLGLPREHSTSVRKVTAEQTAEIVKKLQKTSLTVNNLDDFSVGVDQKFRSAILNVTIDGKQESVVLTPLTVDVLLENLKSVLPIMKEIEIEAGQLL